MMLVCKCNEGECNKRVVSCSLSLHTTGEFGSWGVKVIIHCEASFSLPIHTYMIPSPSAYMECRGRTSERPKERNVPDN